MDHRSDLTSQNGSNFLGVLELWGAGIGDYEDYVDHGEVYIRKLQPSLRSWPQED